MDCIAIFYPKMLALFWHYIFYAILFYHKDFYSTKKVYSDHGCQKEPKTLLKMINIGARFDIIDVKRFQYE